MRSFHQIREVSQSKHLNGCSGCLGARVLAQCHSGQRQKNLRLSAQLLLNFSEPFCDRSIKHLNIFYATFFFKRNFFQEDCCCRRTWEEGWQDCRGEYRDRSRNCEFIKIQKKHVKPPRVSSRSHSLSFSYFIFVSNWDCQHL